MPPKKSKAKKSKQKKKEEEPQVTFEKSGEEIYERELNLLTDLNDEFFNKSLKVIQTLMENGRNYEASKVKKYADLLFLVHGKYVAQVKENEQLKPQIERAEIKMKLALEQSTNSQEEMTVLKQTICDAWKESDTAHAREQESQTKMQELIMKCVAFEKKQTETPDDSSEFGNLAKYKNIILRERDRLSAEVMDLEKRLQMQRYYNESLEYINEMQEDAVAKMSAKFRVLDTEKDSLDVKLKQMQLLVAEHKETNARTTAKLDATAAQLFSTEALLEKKTLEYHRQKHLCEKMHNDLLLQTRQLTKNEEDIISLKSDIKEYEDIIRQLRLEDKAKGNTIKQLNQKLKKAVQDLQANATRMYKLNRANASADADITRFKNQINSLDKDLMNSLHKYEEMRRMRENVLRERDTLRSDIVKLNNQMSDLKHTIMMLNNIVDGLRLDINRLNVKLDEAKINVTKAEKERDEMAQEMETLQERIEYYQEQIQMKNDQITEFTEQLQQKNMQLFNVKKNLETVHSEKMILQRNLDTCTQERDNLRSLQIKNAHQVSQLTTEIAGNQNLINGLNLRIERLNNDKKEIQSELKNTESVLASVRKDLKDMKSKNDNLLKVISDDEAKFTKITTELDETRKEKNLIGLQMVRRNDEIVLLKEKVSIMQTALDQGQTQYKLRVEDIRLLKAEISNLRTERDCLSRALNSTADMREEITRLQRSLNQERVKLRALTEDAKIPTGVHRWRILKGEDPSKYELIQKVQMLQRRTLKQEAEKTNLESLLEEERMLSGHLKHVIENLPTSDVKRRLVAEQRVNRVQNRKLKAISAELVLQQIETKTYQCVVTKLQQLKYKICDDKPKIPKVVDCCYGSDEFDPSQPPIYYPDGEPPAAQSTPEEYMDKNMISPSEESQLSEIGSSSDSTACNMYRDVLKNLNA